MIQQAIYPGLPAFLLLMVANGKMECSFVCG